LEDFERNSNIDECICTLRDIYNNLALMKSGGRLVSNSKLLHFLFPKLCTPMDTKNILYYFYGNTNESAHSVDKYIEITKFSFEIINKSENWSNYLDNGWNTTVPKMIDNAIILLVGKSVK
jgi:hypothetical protein